MFEIDKKEFGSFLSELLECRRYQEAETIAPEKADAMVSTVIQMTDEERAEADRRRKRIQGWFIAASVLSLVAILGIYQYFAQFRGYEPMMQCMPLMFPLFGFIFGIYACFGAKEKLPTYYDENKISAYSDGFFRMNLPGVHFNNSNWRYIISWIRIWSILMQLMGPVVWFVACYFALSMDWATVYIASSVVTGVVILLSIFVPIYVVAKKYE